jgi:hypothetical protein
MPLLRMWNGTTLFETPSVSLGQEQRCKSVVGLPQRLAMVVNRLTERGRASRQLPFTTWQRETSVAR